MKSYTCTLYPNHSLTDLDLRPAANCINNLTSWLTHGYSNHPGNLVVSDCIKNAKSGNHKITAVKFNPGEAPW